MDESAVESCCISCTAPPGGQLKENCYQSGIVHHLKKKKKKVLNWMLSQKKFGNWAENEGFQLVGSEPACCWRQKEAKQDITAPLL